MLRDAGWFPGRSIDIQRWQEEFAVLELHEAGLRFWREFGGLRVEVRGRGITRARVPFSLDPSDADRFPTTVDEDDDWSLAIGRPLVPIGLLSYGYNLAIDEWGTVFQLETWAARCGPVDEAIEGLILGVMAEEIPDTDLPLPLSAFRKRGSGGNPGHDEE